LELRVFLEIGGGVAVVIHDRLLARTSATLLSPALTCIALATVIFRAKPLAAKRRACAKADVLGRLRPSTSEWI